MSYFKSAFVKSRPRVKMMLREKMSLKRRTIDLHNEVVQEYKDLIVKVDKMKDESRALRETSMEIADDLIQLEGHTKELKPGVKKLTHSVREYCHERDIEHFLDRIFDKLDRYGKSINLVVCPLEHDDLQELDRQSLCQKQEKDRVLGRGHLRRHYYGGDGYDTLGGEMVSYPGTPTQKISSPSLDLTPYLNRMPPRVYNHVTPNCAQRSARYTDMLSPNVPSTMSPMAMSRRGMITPRKLRLVSDELMTVVMGPVSPRPPNKVTLIWRLFTWFVNQPLFTFTIKLLFLIYFRKLLRLCLQYIAFFKNICNPDCDWFNVTCHNNFI